MKLCFLFIFCVVVAACFSGEDDLSKAPSIIQEIIASIQAKQGRFDPSFLPKVTDPRNVRKTMTKDFMSYSIQPPKGSKDRFTDEVIFNAISNQFWILRMGGEGGVYILYGPGTIDKKAASKR